MDYKEYIKELDRLYSVGNTTEHSFRGSLQNYLQSLLHGFVVTNEPRRFECGAPDYVITLKNEPIAFLEAKDINDPDLDGRKEHKEQFKRYKEALNRVIFTDYLDFHLYIDGEFVDSVRIAQTRGEHIVGIQENESKFNEMIISLATGGRQRITSSSRLARQMAGKAHLLAEIVKRTLDVEGEESDVEIAAQLRAFRDVLIHDLKAEEFADIYAQTIVYGMFTARLNDTTPEDFSRQEASELIPKSNPFLRRIFQSIAGYDIDSNLEWIVDDLASMFAATDAAKIMAQYGSNKRHSDPLVHFYEDFLAEYDPKLRKARGVWYTPAPVVKFIVKSVDEILQKEFGLPMGLADSSTIKVSRAIDQSRDKRATDGMKHEEIDVPRVQILDPATGTGTFLAEVIEQIRDKFNGMEGMWSSYVEKSLIPRINGFEILMASYTIAHLKLSLTLKNTGYTAKTDQRLNVFLTNSLEEATPRATNLFAKWLSNEADAASKIKNETPVMICLGNPPYSISSQNSGTWITNLVADYKRNLNERNIQPLSDDYIKFIRLGQYYINKNGEGILAYISNNGFLDGIIHRQMRKSLLEEFDKLYILNLHGNSRRKETAPDGSPDENVFDIMQGVSINLFVKSFKGPKKTHGKVFYKDVYGLREEKYKFLLDNDLLGVDWGELEVKEPQYFFVPKDFSAREEYEKGIKLTDIIRKYSTGVKTRKDNVFVGFSENDIKAMLRDANCLSADDFNKQYSTRDSDLWKFDEKKKYLIEEDTGSIYAYDYRPFDVRKIYYPLSNVEKLIPRGDSRKNAMINMLQPNVMLGISKQSATDLPWSLIFVSSQIVDMCQVSGRTKEASYYFPLYLYGDDGTCVPNLFDDNREKFNAAVGREITPEELIQYIYGILHSPSYRAKYKEFLKIDFPRIPLPENQDVFKKLGSLGKQLMDLHLMNESSNWPRTVTFPGNGDNTVSDIKYADGMVYINQSQYFGNVSDLAWNFFIGGYQPAQKWLKDRKGRKLEWEDVMHYGHIIYALQETDRIMKEIDEVFQN